MAKYDLDSRQRAKLRELCDLTRDLAEKTVLVAPFNGGEHRCIVMHAPESEARAFDLTETDRSQFDEEGLVRLLAPGSRGGVRFIPTPAAFRAVDSDFEKPTPPSPAPLITINSPAGPVQFAVGDHNRLAQQVEQSDLAAALAGLLDELLADVRGAVPEHDVAAIEAAAEEAKASPAQAVGPLRRIGACLADALDTTGKRADALDKIAKAYGHLGKLLGVVAAIIA